MSEVAARPRYLQDQNNWTVAEIIRNGNRSLMVAKTFWALRRLSWVPIWEIEQPTWFAILSKQERPGKA